MSKRFMHIAARMSATGIVFFFLGRLTAAPAPALAPASVLIDVDQPWTEQRACMYQPVQCPAVECPTWPMHKEVLAAKTEAAKMDAYLAGAESIWWATPACERAATAPCCSQVVEQVWDVEYNLSMFNFRVMNENIENRNWWKACRELLRVWPTESVVEGNYPEDFPKYCW